MTPAERIVDEVLPEELDWRDLVDRYPKTSVLVAAALGFALGRQRGPVLVSAVSAWAVAEMTRNLESALGGGDADA